MWIWYRGDFFRGFQSQRGGNTVQQTISEAVAPLEMPGSVLAAGRTDRGVHARMQVIAMRLASRTSVDDLAARLGSAAPGALGVVASKLSVHGFHPSWSATRKEYRYRVALGRVLPLEWAPFAWIIREHPRFRGAEPDPSRMADVLRHFSGARDFIAFHEKSSPRRSRTLHEASMRELEHGVFELRLVGDGFARFQVRYLAGAAALVAAGIVPEDALRASLADGVSFPGLKAPPAPLVLWDVVYPPPLDPFSNVERVHAPGIPAEPPFASASTAH
ncbi:MAG TPA: tRNA pseudouridine(38-40) synthase TruA [Myxococcaceae bacterium]|nr:tRNA pseudouridine(38-40) synthase TruA [Myxococcaceae bacterium]